VYEHRLIAEKRTHSVEEHILYRTDSIFTEVSEGDTNHRRKCETASDRGKTKLY
jgi:hypothetical protein